MTLSLLAEVMRALKLLQARLVAITVVVPD
jgi:hypothetical protein